MTVIVTINCTNRQTLYFMHRKSFTSFAYTKLSHHIDAIMFMLLIKKNATCSNQSSHLPIESIRKKNWLPFFYHLRVYFINLTHVNMYS